jgi:hypothetical protein
MNLPEPRMTFGYCLLLALFALAVVIAIGHVQESTSYGLQIVLGSLATLAGGFVNWAFGNKKE